MALQVDGVAERSLDGIINALRTARLNAGISQNALAEGLPVRGRAVSEWETGAIQPPLKNLILWSGELDRRLVLVEQDQELRSVRQRPGETWETFVRRQLAWPLKGRRKAWGISQAELGERVGVSRDSIQRWELARVPPRPIALIVWAQMLGCRLALWPVTVPRIPGPRPEPVPISVLKY
ncbi:helix-turn-helix transcriptional regulator [Catenulispora rubra]|uniref:helix-turn-helix transcriptional regulator n=1 Tax=Catenulispora rubra TaxID=280293 RepID=UPI00189258F2|nr:helix-turn-helix transcriptional regulator [Catenulispora rubra]